MIRLVLLLLSLLPFASAAQADEVFRTEPRPGITQSYLFLQPSGTPAATLLLFAGGNGGIQNGRSENFLVRTRTAFVTQGFAVATMTLPSDHSKGIDEAYRAGPDAATDAAAVIADLRRRVPGPVWLVGTSNGTVSVSNIAARLKQGGPDGIVLTSSIVADTRDFISIQKVVDLAQITAPTVVVHNQEDACPSCPFGQVPGFVARFTHATRTQLIPVTGGDVPRSGPCDPLSRHGYLGIEDQVVGLVAKAIKGPI